MSRDLVQKLLPVARAKGTVVTANPKPASAKFYAGIDLAQFNRSEADETARTHDFDSSDDNTFHLAGAKLQAALGLQKLGHHALLGRSDRVQRGRHLERCAPAPRGSF